MTLSPQAFRSVASIHRAGLASAKPAASTVLAGTLYFSTDSGVLERSDGTSWAAYSGAGGQAPSLAAGELLGRGSDSGDGVPEAITTGEYISMTGTEVDLVGAGQTPFIVQDLTTARAAVAGVGKVPADYLPKAQETARLPTGYVTVTTGTGVLGSTATIPAAGLPPTIAYTDRANTFTQNQILQKPAPVLTFYDTSQPANLRVFHAYGGTQRIAFNATNDDNSGAVEVLNFTRLGDAYIRRDVYEKQRTVPLGHWYPVPFNAANFAGMTWSGLTAAQVTVNQYSLVGRTLLWTLAVENFTLAGAAGNPTITLPGGVLSAIGGTIGTQVFVNPAASATWGMGICQVAAGGAYLVATALPSFQWVAGTGNYLYVNVTISIQ